MVCITKKLLAANATKNDTNHNTLDGFENKLRATTTVQTISIKGTDFGISLPLKSCRKIDWLIKYDLTEKSLLYGLVVLANLSILSGVKTNIGK